MNDWVDLVNAAVESTFSDHLWSNLLRLNNTQIPVFFLLTMHKYYCVLQCVPTTMTPSAIFYTIYSYLWVHCNVSKWTWVNWLVPPWLSPPIYSRFVNLLETPYPEDNIRAIMTVWEIKGEIIRTAMCCTQRHPLTYKHLVQVYMLETVDK